MIWNREYFVVHLFGTELSAGERGLSKGPTKEPKPALTWGVQEPGWACEGNFQRMR